MTVSLNSIVGRNRWSHLVVFLFRYSLAHSDPCDRSTLDQSAQPWLKRSIHSETAECREQILVRLL